MEIKNCPTEQTIADFFTKSIQGKQFYKLRNIVMGHDTIPVDECVETSDEMTTGTSTKKRVGKNNSRVSMRHGYR